MMVEAGSMFDNAARNSLPTQNLPVFDLSMSEIGNSSRIRVSSSSTWIPMDGYTRAMR